MFDGSTFRQSETHVSPGDLLVMYSDGVTEAEDPEGRPFEEAGLQEVVARYPSESPAELGGRVIKAVEAHAKESRFADDLTILILRRTPAFPATSQN
jgi:serine phosphatase RsbU (regulator of sigma subunit)